MTVPMLVDEPKTERETEEFDFGCRIAGTRRDRLEAFRLVYQKYLPAELIQPNKYGIRVTPYHLLPTTNVFVATQHSRIICTVTLIGDGQYGLPMESIYSEEVEECRRRNLYVGEVSCLAFEPMPLNRFLVVFMQLTRLMAQHARAYGMDQFLIAVHPQHARFYQRFMGMEQIGALKTYPSVRDAPAVACCLDFAKIDRDRPRCYAAYFGSRLPADDLISHPMTDNEIRLFRPLAEQAGLAMPQMTFTE
jgi:hypothetical protein